MTWVKRNLYFLIGSFVALLLMGLAGFYVFTKSRLNAQTLTQLNERYEALNTLNNQNPHPGNPPKGPDNIQAARDQQLQLKEFSKKTRKFFQPIPAIPATESGKVSSQEFTTALRTTIDRMQNGATNASVALPPSPQGYNFSFDAVKNKFVYAAGSLEPLSVQLGEVKTICDVVFQAKVNSLDSIRRERVSADDNTGPPSDYLSEKSATNQLAVLTPYELTFRCFTPELAAVVSGFASSPYGMLVRTINVETAPATVTTPEPTTPTTPTYYVPTVPTPQPSRESDEAAFRRRYGLEGGPRLGEGGAPVRSFPQPQPHYVVPQPGQPAKGGLQTIIDEKQLRVTMLLHVVKLLPEPK